MGLEGKKKGVIWRQTVYSLERDQKKGISCPQAPGETWKTGRSRVTPGGPPTNSKTKKVWRQNKTVR